MEDFLQKLNEEQIRPVLETQGPVLVIAGAGSGKTRVLTGRIAYLVEKGLAYPEQILAITFTNKASNEMRERLTAMIDSVDAMWICTIHSMCVRILRREADKIGYNKDFSIYSESDKELVLKKLIKEKNITEDGFIKTLKTHISIAKNKGVSADRYYIENKYVQNIGVICECFSEYEKILLKNNAMDFDDLLINTQKLFAQNPETCLKYSERFKYIHVDEFQDTNKIQYEIIRDLATVHQNIFVVGDDDQSIYGWRGADIGNILNFEKDFKNAKTFKLERNYRSTKKILKLANSLIKLNEGRKVKSLWTENEEGENIEYFCSGDETGEAHYTALKIRQMLDEGKSYSDFAVLVRLNALSRSYEQEFLKYNINYKVFGGFKFYERKEIKDLTAYIRILVNPLDDEAIMRVINVPKRGIGDKVIQSLSEYAGQENITLFDAIFEVENISVSSGAKNKVLAFKSLIAELLVDKETKTLTETVKSIIERTNFYSQFDDTEEGQNKRQYVDEFISSVEEFEKLNPNSDINDFLSSVTLSSDADEIASEDYVTISTIHAVKGLEFNTVFVGGMDEGIFPLSRATANVAELEEERRLMYVAITRAQEKLFLTRSETRFLYGNRQITLPSRFLKECGIITVPKRESFEKKSYEDRFERKNYEERRFERQNYYGGEERESGNAYGKTTSFASSYTSQSAVKKQVSGVTNSNFVAGKTVKHAKFGLGTIIQTKNSGDNLIVDVAFKGVGIKSLSAKFAPMEIVD